MAFSATERGVEVPARVGATFQLLMQLRMLIAAISLLLLPRDQLTYRSIFLFLCVTGLSWIAGRHWERILPSLLRHPLLVALDVVVSFSVLSFGGLSGPFFLATVTTAAIAGLLYRWPGMLAVCCFEVLCYYAALGVELQTDGTATFQSLAGQPAYYPLIGFAGVALRRILDEQAAHEAARRQAVIAAAAAEERTRLAREMHDSLAKTLRGIALAAAALPMWVQRDSRRACDEAARIASAVEIASREARGLITGLRDDTVTRPLPEAIRAALDAWSADHDVRLSDDLDPAADLPLRARYEALAILGEALANVARHAHATEVTVRLTAAGGWVTLTISDDGRGFGQGTLTPAGLAELARDGHYGLLGLSERAERVGGDVTVTSAPGKGTTVALRLPTATAGQAETQARLAEAG